MTHCNATSGKDYVHMRSYITITYPLCELLLACEGANKSVEAQ